MPDSKDRVTEEKEPTRKTLDKSNIGSWTVETCRQKDTEDNNCMDRVEEALEENREKIEETAWNIEISQRYQISNRKRGCRQASPLLVSVGEKRAVSETSVVVGDGSPFLSVRRARRRCENISWAGFPCL